MNKFRLPDNGLCSKKGGDVMSSYQNNKLAPSIFDQVPAPDDTMSP